MTIIKYVGSKLQSAAFQQITSMQSYRYTSKRTWKEFVIQEIPKDKYPTMHETYLSKAKTIS